MARGPARSRGRQCGTHEVGVLGLGEQNESVQCEAEIEFGTALADKAFAHPLTFLDSDVGRTVRRPETR